MEIKNLSQFKKAMKNGCTFKIVEHFIKPDYVGQVRCVQVLQTNGMYTGIAGQPTAEVSRQNRGRGSWIEFGKASDWIFEDGLCKQFFNGNPVWTLKVMEGVK